MASVPGHEASLHPNCPTQAKTGLEWATGPEQWPWSSFRFYAYGETGTVHVNDWQVLKMKIRTA